MPAGWTWPPVWRAPRAMACEPYCAPLGEPAVHGMRRSLPVETAALPGPAARCDHRIAWQALLILQHHAVDTGDWAGATQHARLARDLAAAAGDDPRLAWSSAELAWLSARSDSIDAGLPLLQQAQRLAQRSGDPYLLARAKLAEARMAAQRGDLDGMRRLAEQALPLAQRAASPRLEAAVLTFLSDAYAKLGRPADALRAAERGLPIVRRHHDRRIELALTNNAGLAKIGLKRSSEGLQDLARVEALASTAGLGALRAQVLREYDEALAAAGDARGALALFHRERALSAEVLRQNRDAALKQLRQRNDHERQQRDIELLERDNQLKGAALANRELMQRIWAVAALALLLCGGGGGLAVPARAQHAAAAGVEPGPAARAERARPADQPGQPAPFPVGDADRSVHWAPRARASTARCCWSTSTTSSTSTTAMATPPATWCCARWPCGSTRRCAATTWWCAGAARSSWCWRCRCPPSRWRCWPSGCCASSASAPVMVQGQPVRVTVSIGYARFPLPPNTLPVAWEQAINLADMALYTAKSQGRNRAVGIVAAQAQSPPELRHIEGDFDRAWHEGRVTLKVAPGPLAMA